MPQEQGSECLNPGTAITENRENSRFVDILELVSLE